MAFLDTNGLSLGGLDFGEIGPREASDLIKALQAGGGTDASLFTGGRALIPENLEGQVVNALVASKDDLKLMNTLYQQKVGSPIHEYTRRNFSGDYQTIFAQEGAPGKVSNQDLERVIRAMKYMQTLREVTLQMQVATSLEDAIASEIEQGTFTLLQGAEYASFVGDSSVVPSQYDGVVKQVKNHPRANLLDMRGQDMTSNSGEQNLSLMSRMIFQQGGSANLVMMPPLISDDIQTLVRSRLLFRPGDKSLTTVIYEYPTTYGTLKIAGDTAGPNKFFFPKNKPVNSLDATTRPDAPTIATNAQPRTGGRGFSASEAGTYFYQVYAIDENGISLGSNTSGQAVSTSQEIRIVITPGAKPGTGFIICRSKKNAADGSDCREMVRVAKSVSATTNVLDENDDLPGTGEILFLSDRQINRAFQWDSFLPLMKFDLYPTNRVVTPFMLVWFGTPDVKIPWHNGVIKNVGHADVLGWY